MRALLQDIAGGSFDPGDRLPPETALVTRFGASRGVVRESLRGLEERGVVVVRHGSGAHVRAHEEWNVLDADVLSALLETGRGAAALYELLECRKIIEVEAAGFAAERATGEQLTALSDALARLVAAAEEARRNEAAEDAFHQCDIAFHETLVRASGNRALLRIVAPLQQTLIKARRPLARPEQRFERALPEHKAILSAVARRDAQGARDAMTAHLSTVEQYLRAYGERHDAAAFGSTLREGQPAIRAASQPFSVPH